VAISQQHLAAAEFRTKAGADAISTASIGLTIAQAKGQ
jgi:hypothetical protein